MKYRLYIKMNFKKLSLVGAIYFSSISLVFPEENLYLSSCDYNKEKLNYTVKLERNLAKIVYLDDELKIVAENEGQTPIGELESIKNNAMAQAEYLTNVVPKYESLDITKNQNMYICLQFKKVQTHMDLDKDKLQRLEELVKNYKNKFKQTPSPNNEENKIPSEEENKVPVFRGITQLAYLN